MDRPNRPASLGNGVAQFGDHLINAIQRHTAVEMGFRRRFFIQIETSISPYCASASERDRCCGHHQNIDGRPFAPIPCVGARQTVLFINNGKPQILKFHIALENGMCRSEYGYPHGQVLPIFRAVRVPYPALSAIQSPPAHPRPRGMPQDVGVQGFQSGPSKRPARHPRPRSTGTETPPRFSPTHIALQQSVHAMGIAHIRRNIGQGAGLCACGIIGQGRQHLLAQLPPLGHATLGAALLGAQGLGSVDGQKIRHSQTFARRVGGAQLGQRCGFMRLTHRILPIGPSCALFLRGINPFGQIG